MKMKELAEFYILQYRAFYLGTRSHGLQRPTPERSNVMHTENILSIHAMYILYHIFLCSYEC
jgi:hypothetical protein